MELTGITVALLLLLIVPSIILLFHGAVTAFFSTVWTLAWRRWTGALAGAW